MRLEDTWEIITSQEEDSGKESFHWRLNNRKLQAIRNSSAFDF
ncbi:hypothetical protein VULLAG_LOCUS10985 [Vulpes lagopus]